MRYLWDMKTQTETTTKALVNPPLKKHHLRLVKDGAWWRPALEYMDDTGVYKVVKLAEGEHHDAVMREIKGQDVSLRPGNDLLRLPSMKSFWLDEFVEAGFLTVEDVAKAAPEELDDLPVVGLGPITANNLVEEAKTLSPPAT